MYHPLRSLLIGLGMLAGALAAVEGAIMMFEKRDEQRQLAADLQTHPL